MSMKIATTSGDKVKRGDVFYLNPDDVVVRENLRGRHKPPSDEAIIAMAESIKTEGQIQAVECRRMEDQRLLLTLGFTRTAAVRLIRVGFTDSAGEFQQDPEFKLKVMVTDCNDQEAFMRNVVENAVRNQTSPIDDMLNQRRMRDDYGLSDADIARRYRYSSQSKVAQLKKLLSLDEPMRSLVHDGTLAVTAAIDLLDAPAETRQEIVNTASTKPGKVNGAKVRSAVREVINDEHREEHIAGTNVEPISNGKPKQKSRSMSEVRVFLEELATDSEEAAISRFCADMLKFLNGLSTDKAMVNAIQRLYDAG